MEYFLLFIHYGFYVFFIMCFAAYVFAVTSSKKIEILSMVMLAVYTIMELSAVLMVNSYCGNGTFIYYFLLAGIIISSIIVAVLKLKNCADMSIWIPFCIVFSPFIIIPVLASVPFIKVK